MTMRFQPRGAFGPPTQGYRILPLRFMRWSSSEVLVTNDAGEFIFLEASIFSDFAQHRLDPLADAYRTLKARHFLSDGDSDVPIELLATKVRTKRAFLRGFTRLHIFVVTLRCDHSCPYCQVSRVTQDRTRFDMSRATAGKAIELMFRSPAPALKMEFQGGEPLLNFELIQWMVERAQERNRTAQRDLQFVIATNLAALTDDMLRFCAEHDIHLSTSLDGPRDLHNTNRPRPGNDSFECTIRGIERARATLGDDRVSALMTTTVHSLRQPIEIIDEYRKQRFHSIFLRSISPFGFAVRGARSQRADTRAFLDFYKAGLAYIIELNRQGEDFREIYAQILLNKILTPFSSGYVDLQSPAGAGINVVAYNYDGAVYASDEGRMLAEMHDHAFHLGNVHRDSYASMFGGDKIRAIVNASCVETLPGCSECAFAPYCGSDPVWNWSTQRDPIGHRPTSEFCTKHMGLLTHLFDLLRSGDAFTQRLFMRWAATA
jgi:uncharacterized protein